MVYVVVAFILVIVAILFFVDTGDDDGIIELDYDTDKAIKRGWSIDF